jgi:hypothetical protein
MKPINPVTPADPLENDSSTPDRIYEMVKDFEGVRGLGGKSMMKYMPLILLIISTLIIIFTKDVFIMYASMIAAVALTIIVFQLLMHSIPRALNITWRQGIINEISANDCLDKESGDPQQTPKNCHQEHYAEFIREFEDMLNNGWGQYTLALVFSLILEARSLFEFWKWLPTEFWTGLIYKAGGWYALYEGARLHLIVYLTDYPVEEPLKFWLGLTFEPFIGFLLGLIAWRMIVTSAYVRKLSQRFDLSPRMNNPDKCGGMEPIGRLSLLNASIISIWGVFLGGWIIMGPVTKYGGYYTPLYFIMATLPVIMAIVTFFLPLWGIHEVMANKKEDFNDELNELALNIHILTKEKFELTLKQKINSDLDKNIEIMENIYQDIQNYPTWPFNHRIMIAFITSQAVPFLSLSGLAAPIANSIGSLIGFFGQFGNR